MPFHHLQLYSNRSLPLRRLNKAPNLEHLRISLCLRINNNLMLSALVEILLPRMPLIPHLRIPNGALRRILSPERTFPWPLHMVMTGHPPTHLCLQVVSSLQARPPSSLPQVPGDRHAKWLSRQR